MESLTAKRNRKRQKSKQKIYQKPMLLRSYGLLNLVLFDCFFLPNGPLQACKLVNIELFLVILYCVRPTGPFTCNLIRFDLILRVGLIAKTDGREGLVKQV